MVEVVSYRHDLSRAITSSHIVFSVQAVNTSTFSETVLEGHQGPIFSVALTGQGDCVRVASARCRLVMYNVLHNTRCTLVTVHRTLHAARYSQCTDCTVHHSTLFSP